MNNANFIKIEKKLANKRIQIRKQVRIMEVELQEKELDINQKQTIKTIKIGKSQYTVISIFNGTRTASSILYDAAVKRIIAENFNL